MSIFLYFGYYNTFFCDFELILVVKLKKKNIGITMSFNWEYCSDIKTTFISIQPLQAYTARPKSAIPINYIAPAAIWYFDPGVNFHPWYIALPY